MFISLLPVQFCWTFFSKKNIIFERCWTYNRKIWIQTASHYINCVLCELVMYNAHFPGQWFCWRLTKLCIFVINVHQNLLFFLSYKKGWIDSTCVLDFSDRQADQLSSNQQKSDEIVNLGLLGLKLTNNYQIFSRGVHTCV